MNPDELKKSSTNVQGVKPPSVPPVPDPIPVIKGERATTSSLIQNDGLEINPELKRVHVEKTLHPEFETPEVLSGTPPMIETGEQKTVTSSPSITVQSSISKETATLSESAQTYIVSHSEIAGKNPARDSIVGLYRLKVKKDERDERLLHVNI